MRFTIITNERDKDTVWVDPAEVVSVWQYKDRQGYGGYFDASEITLRNGKNFKVYGHVEKTVLEAKWSANAGTKAGGN